MSPKHKMDSEICKLFSDGKKSKKVVSGGTFHTLLIVRGMGHRWVSGGHLGRHMGDIYSPVDLRQGRTPAGPPGLFLESAVLDKTGDREESAIRITRRLKSVCVRFEEDT